jgi:hypothetical protein
MVYRDQAHDDSRSVTIGELRSEFSTLDRQLTSQFDSQYAFHKDVISDILKRIEEAQRSIESVRDEARRSIESVRHDLDQGFKKSRGSIDGLKAINRNRFAIRPYMQIWKYPTDEDEVPKYFPTTVAAFWALQTPPNRGFPSPPWLPRLTLLPKRTQTLIAFGILQVQRLSRMGRI